MPSRFTTPLLPFEVIAELNGPRYWLVKAVKKAGDATDLPKKSFGRLEK